MSSSNVSYLLSNNQKTLNTHASNRSDYIAQVYSSHLTNHSPHIQETLPYISAGISIICRLSFLYWTSWWVSVLHLYTGRRGACRFISLVTAESDGQVSILHLAIKIWHTNWPINITNFRTTTLAINPSEVTSCLIPQSTRRLFGCLAVYLSTDYCFSKLHNSWIITMAKYFTKSSSDQLVDTGNEWVDLVVFPL